MEWSAVRGERKRVLMDLDVMTQQHSPFIVQYYGSFIQDVSTGILWGRGGRGARCEHVGLHAYRGMGVDVGGGLYRM